MKKIATLITGINLIAVIVVINLILGLFPFWRIDLTKNKIHSLSNATKEIIRKMDDLVTVKVYLTADLPPEVKPIATSLKTILEEMARINPGKMKVSIIDPLKNEKAKIEAENYGIQPLQFSNIKQDKFEVQNGYFGLVMLYGKKQVVLPVANDVGNLEYFVVSGLKNLMRSKTPSVALVSSDGNQYFHKFLGRDYQVQTVTLSGEDKLPAEAESLVVVGGFDKIDEKGITKIRDWVNSGKGLIGFVSQIEVDQQMKATLHEPTGLEKVFAENGMEMEPKLVWDQASAIANFQTPQGAFLAKYPYWPQISVRNINNSLPVNSGVTSLMVPWASPLKLSNGAKELFTSSENSITVESNSNLIPGDNKVPTGAREKKTIGAINTSKGKVALVASPMMINDSFVVNSQQNLILALNLVDYFSQDKSLLSIRGKGMEVDTLKELSDSQKTLVKGINLVLPLLILAMTMAILNVIRKKENEKWSSN